MPEHWRIVDTGLAAPARNIALSRALLEARAADEIASTLRFSRSTRCALIAARHSAAQELDVDFCRDRGIAVERGLINAPAMYVDERQLVWELLLHRREVDGAGLHALSRRICNAAAAALSALGVDARLRGRAQVEIGGRVVSESGCAVERDAILFQSRLLLDTEPAIAYGVLRSPWSFDAAQLALEAPKRMTSLAAELGRAPDARLVKANLAEAFESELEVEFRDADPGISEHSRWEAAMPALVSRDWTDHIAAPIGDAPLLAAEHRTAAGTIEASVIYERATRILRRTWFTGGPRFEPPRLLPDLESVLSDVPLSRVKSRVETFFGSRPVDAGGFTAADFVAVVKRAVRQPLLA